MVTHASEVMYSKKNVINTRFTSMNPTTKANCKPCKSLLSTADCHGRELEQPSEEVGQGQKVTERLVSTDCRTQGYRGDSSH